MISTLRKRLRSEEKGFTLIELLVVVIILGILTAIAIPSYLSFRGRANNSADKANVRSIIPSVESYFSDNNTYTGMTLAVLQATYDQALDLSKYIADGLPAARRYCVQATRRPARARLSRRTARRRRSSPAPARKPTHVKADGKGAGDRALSLVIPQVRDAGCRRLSV